jgi:hypothetical protein
VLRVSIDDGGGGVQARTDLLEQGSRILCHDVCVGLWPWRGLWVSWCWVVGMGRKMEDNGPRVGIGIIR